MQSKAVAFFRKLFSLFSAFPFFFNCHCHSIYLSITLAGRRLEFLFIFDVSGADVFGIVGFVTHSICFSIHLSLV